MIYSMFMRHLRGSTVYDVIYCTLSNFLNYFGSYIMSVFSYFGAILYSYSVYCMLVHIEDSILNLHNYFWG